SGARPSHFSHGAGLRVCAPNRVVHSKIRVDQWFAANQILVIASRTGDPRLAKGLRRFGRQTAQGEGMKALAVERGKTAEDRLAQPHSPVEQHIEYRRQI